MVQQYRFIVELHAPANPENIANYFNKVKHLFSRTKSVSIASKPFRQSILGFDLSFNLANYLLKQDKTLDILFHLTCHDLNKVTIESKLTLLKQLGIKRLLIITGDSYEQSTDIRLRKLQYANSHELARVILSDYRCLFDSVGVAGYPGGNGRNSNDNEEECHRLADILEFGASEVYTQCVFNLNSFAEFDRMLGQRFPRVRVVPSVALFKSSSDLTMISKLTRVINVSIKTLEENLRGMDLQQAEAYSIGYIDGICSDLIQCTSQASLTIDLCTFGHFDLAQSLMDKLNLGQAEQRI